MANSTIKADKVRDCIRRAENLKQVYLRAANLEHAIKDRQAWQPYIPTHFIYAFFSFNSLYNVNWAKSISSGRIEDNTRHLRPEYDNNRKLIWRAKTEREQINDLVSFCFSDKSFSQQYKDIFIRDITLSSTLEELSNNLSHIRRGSNIKNEESNFLIAKGDLLDRGIFNEEVIQKIIIYIYGVRCNIFHGAKTTTDMMDEGQQKRILFYANIVIAICSMLFSYLDYLSCIQE